MNKDREQKLIRLEAIREKKRRLLSSKPLYEPHLAQKEVHLDNNRIRFITAGNGCHAAGTVVRMFDGSTKAVEDVVVGDLLMGPDSTPREVRHLHRGRSQMARIIPLYSEPYVVNIDHALSLYRWKWQNSRMVKVYEEITVRDYLALPDNQQQKSYQWKPNGIDYPESTQHIDPYILGAWLGDGHAVGPLFTNADPEVIQAIADYAEKRGLSFRKYPTPSKAFTLSIASFSRKSINTFREDLKGYELINNKHIPPCYMIASRKQRLELLAGLIDTDGYKDRRCYYEIVQVRKHLAEQIRELADSLGFKTSLNPSTVNGTTYHRVYIIGDISQIPVRIPRKMAGVYGGRRCPQHENFEVELLPEDDYYGFEVDKDHLFLLANYTVQRNSGKTCLAVNEALWWATGVSHIRDEITKVPATVVILLDNPAKVEEVWLSELRNWYPLDDRCELKKNGRPHISEIVFQNGSKILFMFHQQEALAFEGIQFDYLIADEPFPRHCWIGLIRGMRKKGAKPRTLLIGTPIGQPWMYREIWKPAEDGERTDIGLHVFDTESNRANLAEGYIEEYAANLTEDERKVRLTGRWGHLKGLALAGFFDRRKHIVPRFTWAKDDPCVIIIDPHYAKLNTAICLGATRQGKLYYIKELAVSGSATDMAMALKDFKEGLYVVDIVCDSLGSTPGTGGDGQMSFIEKLNSLGIYARATDFKEKSDGDFLERIRQVLHIPTEPDNFGQQEPVLYIMEGCPGIVNDIENVQWVKVKNANEFKDKLEISNRDYLACLKYGLATNLAAMARFGRRPAVKRTARSPWSGRKPARRW